VQSGVSGFGVQTIPESLEIKMFGYGIVGTLLIICLVVWLVRRA
jgi:hypothetical protein